MTGPSGLWLALALAACPQASAPAVRLLVADRAVLEGGGPHPLGVVALDAHGRAVPAPDVVALVSGPAHEEGGSLLCDGTGPVTVTVQAGELRGAGTLRCVFLGSLTARPEAARMVEYERRGWRDLLDARDRFGQPHAPGELRPVLSSDDETVVRVEGTVLRAMARGKAQVTARVSGLVVTFPVSVTAPTCLRVQPRGDWQVTTAERVDLCDASAECLVRAPLEPSCGPWLVQLLPHDPTRAVLRSEVAVDLRLRSGVEAPPAPTEVLAGCAEVASAGRYTVSAGPCPPTPRAAPP